jgi:hypothetical protein
VARNQKHNDNQSVLGYEIRIVSTERPSDIDARDESESNSCELQGNLRQ